MNAPLLAACAAVAALCAGSALAQDQASQSLNKPHNWRADTARSAAQSGVDTSVNVPADDQSQYGQTQDGLGRIAVGPTQVVTNGPVPDTPRNRARFGGPMSHGGRSTAPAGN